MYELVQNRPQSYPNWIIKCLGIYLLTLSFVKGTSRKVNSILCLVALQSGEWAPQVTRNKMKAKPKMKQKTKTATRKPSARKDRFSQ